MALIVLRLGQDIVRNTKAQRKEKSCLNVESHEDPH